MSNSVQNVALRSDTTPDINERNTTLEYSLAAVDQPFFVLSKPSLKVLLRSDILTDLVWTVSVSKTASTAVSFVVRSNELCNVYWQVALSRAAIVPDFRSTVTNFEKNY